MNLGKCLYQGLMVCISESLEPEAITIEGACYGVVKECGEPKYLFSQLLDDHSFNPPMLIPINSVYMWPSDSLKEITALRSKGSNGKIINLFERNK